MTLVVHPHFHRRRTGITRHVEAVLPALGRSVEARALGAKLGEAIPRIGWRELWRRARREGLLWHAHRNNELLAGLLLRCLAPRVRVAFTRHSSARAGRRDEDRDDRPGDAAERRSADLGGAVHHAVRVQPGRAPRAG